MAKATTKAAPRQQKTATKAARTAARPSRSATTPVAPVSKSATIISLLGGKGGASIEDLTTATGWQKHSVRGFLSGALKKKQGLEVTSEKIDGVRRYRIAGAGR
jgi:hypothetical protein